MIPDSCFLGVLWPFPVYQLWFIGYGMGVCVECFVFSVLFLMVWECSVVFLVAVIIYFDSFAGVVWDINVLLLFLYKL